MSEQEIVEALHRVPRERWDIILAEIQALQPQPGEPGDRPIRTAADLLGSGVVGAWADRTDVGDTGDFARRLRREAEGQGRDDAP